MPRTRRLAVLVLSLALIAPWAASAAGPKSEPGREPAASLWGWLTHLWAGAGCIIDPSGCAGTQGDAGCIADPDGCASAQRDEGCILDPSGCAETHGDEGCIIDPSGAPCVNGR